MALKTHRHFDDKLADPSLTCHPCTLSSVYSPSPSTAFPTLRC